MKLRDGEKWPGWRKAKLTLQESKKHDPELKKVYGKLLQEVYFRLDDAMQAFFRRAANGETPGFPRVRPRHNFFTLNYPASYLKIEGSRLILPTGGGGRHDLSQRQMVMKEHQERSKYLNRAVFNDWGLYLFLQMLLYKCVLYGKELHQLDERNTSKMCSGCGRMQAMPLWKRTYRCVECGLVMDRDDNSAVNILMRFLARRGPYTSRKKCDVLQEDQVQLRSHEDFLTDPHAGIECI
jgi:transposase